MSCDCPGAPHLSGVFFQNVQKQAAELVRVEAPWCSVLEEDGEILFSAWEATPETPSAPLTLADQTVDNVVTAANVGGGRVCQLYRVINTVNLKRTAESPTETLLFTFWV